MSVIKLFKAIWILAENFPVSHNLAENSNSWQNTANPNISRIFGLAGFICFKITARVFNHMALRLACFPQQNHEMLTVCITVCSIWLTFSAHASTQTTRDPTMSFFSHRPFHSSTFLSCILHSCMVTHHNTASSHTVIFHHPTPIQLTVNF